MCHCNISLSNDEIGVKYTSQIGCYNVINIFFARFMSSQICDDWRQQADLATEWDRQSTTARTNQATGLTSHRAANWAPEVAFSPFRTLSRRQLMFPFCC